MNEIFLSTWGLGLKANPFRAHAYLPLSANKRILSVFELLEQEQDKWLCMLRFVCHAAAYPSRGWRFCSKAQMVRNDHGMKIMHLNSCQWKEAMQVCRMHYPRSQYWWMACWMKPDKLSVGSSSLITGNQHQEKNVWQVNWKWPRTHSGASHASAMCYSLNYYLASDSFIPHGVCG